jgi:hypothetical protein
MRTESDEYVGPRVAFRKVGELAMLLLDAMIEEAA